LFLFSKLQFLGLAKSHFKILDIKTAIQCHHRHIYNLLLLMVIMVINMTNHETNSDESEVRDRMRKRFQELDARQRKREEAGSAWVFVLYIGFLITFIGTFMMLLFLGVIPLTLEILISIGVILIGVFFMAIAAFLRNAPNIVLDEL